MHIGHMIPFVFTQWLQETFDVPLVVQLTGSFFDFSKLKPQSQDLIFFFGMDRRREILVQTGFEAGTM